MDEAVPTWVKKTYSPRESWKDKPFSKDDARFFSKGINELSDQFTEERERRATDYFAHPKYRSSYLLYFLPLQAAKFATLFDMYPEAMKRAVAAAKSEGVLRIADLGAGPGTASIALLLWLLDPKNFPGEIPFTVEFHWSDLNRTIMEDGSSLVETLANGFPKLREKVKVNINVGFWWKAVDTLPGPSHLTIVGNVLNEAPGGPIDFSQPRWAETWEGLLSHFGGAGALFVEPAMRRPSQSLSKLRDELFERELIAPEATSIWGPCLHAGRCPMASGRDWCHFSVPAQIPGQWFKSFSEGLGSERSWVKFSYLWLASRNEPAPAPSPDSRRVISDPLGKDRRPGISQEVLVCEPEQAGKARVPAGIRRGDLIGS